MNIKFIITIVALSISSWVVASASYNPLQYQQFLKTHICEKCDLTALNIAGDFSSADLMEANLDSAMLIGTFTKGNFKNTEMNQMTGASDGFSEADFSNAQMTHIKLSSSRLIKYKL